MGYLFSRFFWLLLSLALHCIASHVNGSESQSFHVIGTSLLRSARCSSTSTAQAESNNNRLKVVHRHGPCSPVGRWKDPNPGQILRQDLSRVHALHRRFNGDASKATKPGTLLAGTTIPAHAGVGEYVTTVGFGTPKLDFSVILDTGSDLSWIQCKPCVAGCYPQKEPLFDPSRSSTYSNISCSSSDCSLPSFDHHCDSSNCAYMVSYGDGSNSTGFLAQETLTLTTSDVVTDFRFGCGEGYSGDFFGADGLIGLGRGDVSLVSQASEKYGGVFSYCLPTRSSSSGYLAMGAGVQYSPNIKFTRMITEPFATSFYFIELVGISVAGKDLSIPSTVFADLRTIIDSGTTVTWLPPMAYSALRSEFRKHMSNYSLVAPLGILDTCYNFTGYNSIRVPAVALQFSGGVTLNVDGSGILYLESPSKGCLAFASSGLDGFSIVGNMQQRTFDVVYDVPREMIGFGAGGCS